MKSLGLTLMVATLAACSSLPGVAQNTEDDATADQPVTQAQAAPGDVMYQILLGEMAANRGDSLTAVNSYLTAALSSDDPALAERATRIAIEYQDWESAKQAGQHWSSLEPRKLDVQRLIAGVHLRAGDPVGAADALERVLDISGQSFDEGASSVLAALQQEPDAALAVDVAEVLVERHPESSMGHFVFGQLLADNAEWDDALGALDRSITLRSDFSRAQVARARVQLEREQADDAVSVLRQYVESQPEDVAAHQGLAQILVQLGRADAAGIELDALFDRYADRPLLVYNLGLLALELEALDDAERYFERAVALEPSRVDGHYFLGRINDFNRDFEQAISHYDQVSNGANSFEAGLRAAELAGRVSGLDDGLARLNELRSRAEPYSLVRVILSESGLMQYHDDYDGARATLDAGLATFPDDNDLRYARGLLLARLGDEQSFEREMRAVLATEPENAQALNALGYSLADRNVQLDEAADLIGKAIALAPDDAAIIDSKGWLHFRRGEFAQAKAELERAYKIMPDTEIAAHLIEVHWVLGDPDSARALLGEAFDLDGDSDVLDALLRRIPEIAPDDTVEKTK